MRGTNYLISIILFITYLVSPFESFKFIQKMSWAFFFAVSKFEWPITHYLERGLGPAKGKVCCWLYVIVVT